MKNFTSILVSALICAFSGSALAAQAGKVCDAPKGSESMFENFTFTVLNAGDQASITDYKLGAKADKLKNGTEHWPVNIDGQKLNKKDKNEFGKFNDLYKGTSWRIQVKDENTSVTIFWRHSDFPHDPFHETYNCK